MPKPKKDHATIVYRDGVYRLAINVNMKRGFFELNSPFMFEGESYTNNFLTYDDAVTILVKLGSQYTLIF